MKPGTYFIVYANNREETVRASRLRVSSAGVAKFYKNFFIQELVLNPGEWRSIVKVDE